jgi:circadian clock protein KaiC
MSTSTPTTNDNARASTGIPGLDEILCGGFPKERLYLVHGTPGVGKTTLAMQFLLQGVEEGESGLYITLSETQEELELVAASHGWDISKLHLFELAAMEEKARGETESTFFHPSEIELNRTTQTLLDEVQRVQPVRIVFDSLSELRMLAETPLRYRRQILELKQFFSGKQATVLFLDDGSGGRNDLQIESIAHGVLAVESTVPEYGVTRRSIRVQKLRGSSFREGNHNFLIRRGGMVVFPRLVAAEHRGEQEQESVQLGVPGLDALLGGGLDRGTSTMLMGPPGCGKSTLLLHAVYRLAERGEHSLLFLFDETVQTLMGRAAALGMDLAPHIANGRVTLRQIDPAEISPGELTSEIVEQVSQQNVRLVALDSINGYMHAMPAERHLSLQLHELLVYLANQNIITVMVLAQQGIVGTMQSAVDLTYLADTVLLLRYFEAQGAVKQAISVIKKRTGNHERTIREMRITAAGLEVGEPLTRMQGILTGVPQIEPLREAPQSGELRPA